MIATMPDGKRARWPAALVVLLAVSLVTLTNAQTPKPKDASAPASPSSANPTQAADKIRNPAGDVLKDPDEWPDVSSRTVSAPRPAGKPSPADAALVEQLDRALPEIRLEGVALHEAVDYL